MKKKLPITQLLASIGVIMLFSMSSLGQEFTWEWQNPFPVGNGHSDVAWIDDQTIYISGSKGQFLKSFDFGSTWELKSVPTDASIEAINFLDLNIGYGATDNGEIWFTENAGETWTLQFTDPLGSTLRDINFYDVNIGYAVGHAGFAENVLIRTEDGGENWTVADLPIKAGAAFYGIFFVKAISADTIISASWDNTFFSSYDKGVTWDTTQLPVSAGGFYEGGYFVNDSTGFLVGPNAYILKTVDYGETWEIKTGSSDSTEQNTHYFTEAFFLNENTGWVSSFACLYNTNDGGDTWERACEETYGTNRKSFIKFNDQNKGIAVAPFEIYTTTDASTFNQILPTDPINSWNAIDEADGGLFVAGGEGEIFYSNNEGLDWTIISTPVSSTLTDISFLDKNNGWVVGRDSAILKTNDGGANWQALNTEYSGNFNGLYAWNTTDAVVVGDDGNIFKTSNGGTAWTKGTIETTSRINAVHFASIDTGYVVGRSGLIAVTTDGGLTWSAQDAGVLSDLNDVFFVNGNTGYAVGQSGQIIYTENAGVTWTPQISGQSGTLNGVYFLDENNGYVTGSGIVLVTQNGGQTWEVQDTPSGNILNDVLFTTTDKGWVVGSNGNILYFGEDLNTVTGIISSFDNESVTTRIYPNPATSQTTFDMLSTYNGTGKLRVFSISGRLMYSSDLSFESGKSQWTIHPGLSGGVYTFQIITEDKIHSGKVMIRR